MYPFYLELELVKPVVDYFQSKGYKVAREVKIGFLRADVVAIKKGTVVATELKIRNWKQAIIQARNYQLGADYSYIAIPLMKSYNILRKAKTNLEKKGIGMLVVNEKTCNVKKLIDAKKSDKKMIEVTFDNKNKKKNYKRLVKKNDYLI